MSMRYFHNQKQPPFEAIHSYQAEVAVAVSPVPETRE